MSKKFRWRQLDNCWLGECSGYFALVNSSGNYHYARTFRKEQSDILISAVASASLIQAKAAADLALERDWRQFPLPLLLDDPPAKPENADQRSIFGHGCPETSQAIAGDSGATG